MNELQRKPTAQTSGTSLESYDLLDDLIDDYLEPFPALGKTSSAVDATNQLQIASSPSHQGSRQFALRAQKSTPVLVSGASLTSGASSPSDAEAGVSSNSTWKTVVDETVYFAGGLISHPYESTRHFSILRHSSALVYYKGPSTSVTISVFGDSQLPSDRSFWIQRKGFSGNIGMATSALMRTMSNWIDITPSVESLASSVPVSDERAWQRDIKKFLKRASKDKRLSKHVLRETCVLRIPAVATDGYLRVVMCTGESSKKSLCPSPTFRLASTSSDVSVIRGASLTTLPLEIGLKAASVIGNQYVQRVMGPAQAVVQSKIKYIQPNFVKKHPEKLALARAGMKDQFDNFEGNFDATRDVSYRCFHDEHTLDEPPDVIGNDSGPQKPFPIQFEGNIVPGTGQTRAAPTANLSNVPEELLLRLGGIYIGWASIEKSKAINESLHSWHEAIITIGPSPYASPKVIPRKMATVHIVYDFGHGTTFFNTKLKVIVMVPLRGIPKHSQSPAEILAAVSRDKEIALASLSRVMWQPGASLDILSAEKAQKTITNRYIEMRSQIQRHVDSVPVHRVGIRTNRAEAKDEAYRTGGFYIRR
ncbi:hypothetical protein F5B22DRAFT_585653 [Xylaria bambusicola]|uniref:uncharacterized protein n=1 Tax=Xylaria bambusicola TaxID=326684 RepID=UPI002008C7E6|nr:uncharacterized protein F5B22DRAFT_585653 [Xylaria bambusicola]KAI0526409.1 hypothetical protein F5B22DRAFT_585653 [Xylaria bambusicola]